ncbi:unnamed protein product [Merluccius merluccius]
MRADSGERFVRFCGNARPYLLSNHTGHPEGGGGGGRRLWEAAVERPQQEVHQPGSRPGPMLCLGPGDGAPRVCSGSSPGFGTAEDLCCDVEVPPKSTRKTGLELGAE